MRAPRPLPPCPPAPARLLHVNFLLAYLVRDCVREGLAHDYAPRAAVPPVQCLLDCLRALVHVSWVALAGGDTDVHCLLFHVRSAVRCRH